MWLQVLLIIIAFYYCTNYEKQGNTEHNRHRYMTFIIIILVIQSGLRNVAVGDDTYNYSLKFEKIIQTPWSDVIDVVDDRDSLMVAKDPGFNILQKVFSSVVPVFRFFLIAVALFFFIPFCRLAERYVSSFKQIFLFFCIYQALFYSFFSITGIRQTIATVAIIWGVRLIEDNKCIKFFLLVLCASFIHKSALLLLPFYFLGKIPNSKYVMLSVLCALPLLFLAVKPFAGILTALAATDRYAGYAESGYKTGGAINFTLFLIAGCLMTIFAKHKNPDKIPDVLVNACALGLFFSPLTWVDPSFMRVGQYFSLFALITIPVAVDNMNISNLSRHVLFWSIFAILLFTVIRHNVDYAFFWQYMKLPDHY